MKFLSTFPLRGTSVVDGVQSSRYRNFYPRSPCGERLEEYPTDSRAALFLSTFPLRGTSTSFSSTTGAGFIFLSTFPLRGTSLQCAKWWSSTALFLSTFPLRGTSASLSCHQLREHDFYPRSPCGERLYLFLVEPEQLFISIHVPLAGNVCSDLSVHHLQSRDFYPRSPCGERPLPGREPFGLALNFYPRSPCGERPGGFSVLWYLTYFYPRSPCGERRAGARL